MITLGRIGAKALTIVGYVVASVLLFTVVIGGTGFLVGRTEWARVKLLALALPRLQESLGGPLAVSRLDGNLFGTLIVYDLALDDAEGNPAIRAPRVAAHFAPLSLIKGAKIVEELRGEGVWIGMHMLADGRFNLATLTAPRRPGDPPPKPLGAGTRFVIAHAIVDAVLRYQAPSAPGPIRVAEAAVHVECAVDIEEPIVIALAHVDGRVLPPLDSPLHASGKLIVQNGQLLLEKMAVGLAIDEQLSGYLFGLQPISDRLGAATVTLAANGGVSPVEVSVQARFARTEVLLDSAITLGTGGIGWRGAARRPGATLKSNGQLDWFALGELTAEMDSDDLSSFASFGIPVVSTMRGQVRAGATVIRSAAGMNIDGAIHGTSLIAPALKLERVDRLEAHLQTSDLSRGLDLNATAQSVHLAGLHLSTVSITGRADPKLLVARIDSHGPDDSAIHLALRATPAWSKDSPAAKGKLIGAEGELSAALSWRNEKHWPAVKANARIHYEPRRLGADVTALIAGQTIVANLIAREPSGHEAEGMSAWPIEVAARAQGVEIARLPLSQFIANWPAVTGVIDARLSLHGTFAAPVASGILQVESLRLDELRMARFEARLALDGSTLHVDLTAAAANDKGLLLGKATLPLAAGAPLSVHASLSEFPLALSSATVPGVSLIKGTVNASVDVAGTRERPELSGAARARDASVTLGDGGLAYTEGTIDFLFKGEALTLRMLSFRLGAGKVDLTGSGKVAGLMPTALSLHAQVKRYPASIGGVSLYLDGRGDLEAVKEPSGWNGTVTVLEAIASVGALSKARSLQSINRPEGFVFVDAAGRRDAIARKARAAARARAGTTIGAAPALATLNIKVPGSLKVQGKEVETTLKGDVAITLRGHNPRIKGVVTGDGGWVTLLGRRYDIEQLSADFDGERRIDPTLDVRIARNTDVTVVIEVQGRASHPTLTFSARPPSYSAEQVMAMILAGAPDGGGDLQSQEERVVGALSGTFVGQLKDQLLPELPLDVIKVESARPDVVGQQDTRFEAGKYLTESLYVSYVYQLGTVSGLRRLNRNQLQIEYRFAHHFDVQAAFGDNGVGALDLSWGRRF